MTPRVLKVVVVDRGIFQKPNGYWWANDPLRENRVFSMHTRNRTLAQMRYDRQVAELRRYESGELK
jgi:hypothetical protein